MIKKRKRKKRSLSLQIAPSASNRLKMMKRIPQPSMTFWVSILIKRKRKIQIFWIWVWVIKSRQMKSRIKVMFRSMTFKRVIKKMWISFKVMSQRQSKTTWFSLISSRAISQRRSNKKKTWLISLQSQRMKMLKICSTRSHFRPLEINLKSSRLMMRWSQRTLRKTMISISSLNPKKRETGRGTQLRNQRLTNLLGCHIHWAITLFLGKRSTQCSLITSCKSQESLWHSLKSLNSPIF